MRLLTLPGIIMALVAGMLGGLALGPAHVSSAEGSAPRAQALFSLAAQDIPTPTAELTPTLAVTPTEAIATEPVTATATLTTPQATPVPIPTQQPQATLRGNPLDPDFLFSPPDDPVIGPLAWIYLALMLTLFAASAYFYMIKRPQWKGTNTPLYRAANRWGLIGLWVTGLGLLFFLFRVVRFDFFNWRFWLYFWLLAALIAGAWFLYWYRTRYPKEAARFQKVQRSRQYMPGASRAARKGGRNTTQATTTTGVTSEAAAPAPTAPRLQSERKRRKKRK